MERAGILILITNPSLQPNLAGWGDFLRCSKTLTYHCPFPLLSAFAVNLVMQKDSISFNCRSDFGFFHPLEHYGIGFLCCGSAWCRAWGCCWGLAHDGDKAFARHDCETLLCPLQLLGLAPLLLLHSKNQIVKPDTSYGN